MGSIVSKLDADQVMRKSYDDAVEALKTIGVGGTLVPEQYDAIALTYVPSGNGAGEIQTVTFSKDGSDIATLTLTYDGVNRLSTVTRS
jgi:hypothetical protein